MMTFFVLLIFFSYICFEKHYIRGLEHYKENVLSENNWKKLILICTRKINQVIILKNTNCLWNGSEVPM